ncbi:hypothetical protein LPJ78_004250 [Coemansia sp. RSA 989]|nr:hypothetical protein BX667DRAFT_514441 [Coemansia mojavensis]KAJ1740302.1 hypothetical protein LPJ68_003890 [Coemansia sp. RSA 1086]KAJ1748939.1 hypothetical protein LPJ79_004124 [Coemansia sp. RSA 1821]KAJ1863124.1 hypothetical protein LPJ78_004250 [Coemansia sp. RSA 989]KAJ1871865.1 hypothetical protein LPJ55_003559 [Coemansia sp. RSA 990]KAJ2651262.1 hypothetical protein IWW40_001753 [Coemansia sp. RSA 1250]KAJ2673759.1 hypothetical protein IWW42_002171 [Coemansia sp. RSA 1085]
MSHTEQVRREGVEIEKWRQAAMATSDKHELVMSPAPFIASADMDMPIRPARSRWWKGWFSGGTLRFVATYMLLPFVTGVMAGMGEIFANEAMYRWGWRGARPIMVEGRKGRVFPIEKPTAQT